MKLKPTAGSSGKVTGYSFWCPGCKGHHHVTTGWQFNGDMEKPTFSPSVLIQRGHYLRNPPVPGNCACDFQQRFPDKEPWQWPCGICHSFIRDGMIQFLGDCTHALANQTVPLPEYPTHGSD